MANNHFHQAEELILQLGKNPVLLDPRDTPDLLQGIDHLCRPLTVVIRNDIPPEVWGEIATNDRQRLVSAYRNLGNSAEPLYTSTGFKDQGFVNPKLESDIQRMAQQSEAAQYIATCLSSRYNEFAEAINAQDVTGLAISSLKAVAAWKKTQEYFDSERVNYDKGNFLDGLADVERVFWHYL